MSPETRIYLIKSSKTHGKSHLCDFELILPSTPINPSPRIYLGCVQRDRCNGAQAQIEGVWASRVNQWLRLWRCGWRGLG